MNHVKDILAGLGAFIIAAGIIVLVLGGGLKTAYDNNQKVQRLTHMCVEKGYTGWADSGGVNSTSSCTGERRN